MRNIRGHIEILWLQTLECWQNSAQSYYLLWNRRWDSANKKHSQNSGKVLSTIWTNIFPVMLAEL